MRQHEVDGRPAYGKAIEILNGEIRVELGERSYPIMVGAGLLTAAGDVVTAATSARSFVLVTHPGLMERYGHALTEHLNAHNLRVTPVLVPAGERSKSLAMAGRLYADMARAGLDRHGAVLALGGGVIGDLAGFAAATYLRGVDVIQIPTTLLAMADSAIGGKTGVNLPAGKNLVGAFHQPRAVLVDPDVLRSLPPRDVRGGLAEVIKYGVIGDRPLFEFLEANISACLALEVEAIQQVIADSAAQKASVVSVDEREGSLRAILNYGHTAGHAVEKAAGYRRLRHGEAVAIGMVAAARIGVRLGMTPVEAAERIERLLERAHLPTRIPLGITMPELLAPMMLDKKVRSGKPRWVMARDIGEVEIGIEVPPPVVEEVLRELGAG